MADDTKAENERNKEEQVYDPWCLDEPVHVPKSLIDDPSLLQDVLSIHTWRYVLSDSEREHLRSFLPSGLNEEDSHTSTSQHHRSSIGMCDVLDQNVNLHFGHPLKHVQKRLASGFYQPRVALYLRAASLLEQKAHYMRIRRYHAEICRQLEALHEQALERQRKRGRRR